MSFTYAYKSKNNNAFVNKRIRIIKKKKIEARQKKLDDKLKKKSLKDHVKDYFGLGINDYKRIMKQPCAKCGGNKYKQLHHIIPKSQNKVMCAVTDTNKGGNNIENLQVLCKACHEVEHGYKIDSFKNILTTTR